MANMIKLTVYVIDYNDTGAGPEDIIEELKSLRRGYLGECGVTGIDQGTVDIGEWHDDHPLNKQNGDHESYFNG